MSEEFESQTTRDYDPDAWGPIVDYHNQADLKAGTGGEERTDELVEIINWIETAHENLQDLGLANDTTNGTYPVWEARKMLKNEFPQVYEVAMRQREATDGR